MSKRTVCVSIAEASTAAAVERVKHVAEHEPGAAAIEVRLDALRDPDPAALVAACPETVRLMLTCHAEGHAPREAGARLELLRRSVAAGADLVDVDVAHVAELRRLLAEKGPADPVGALVVSEHDFEGTPDDAALAARFARLAELARPGDVVKLATTAQDATDCLRLLDAGRAHARTSGQQTVAVAMGPASIASRVLAPVYELAFTFAFPHGGKPTAPGQPDAAMLRTLYRHGELGPKTAIYGLVGRPVAHSLSPVIHNVALKALGIDAVYVPFLVEDAAAFFAAAAEHGVRGLSVTAPHKLAAFGAATAADPAADRAQAANTLIARKGGGWDAANTDAAAAADSLEAVAGKLAGKRVTILGSGGAARALVRALAARGADVAVRARSVTRGEEAARGGGTYAGQIEDLREGEADIVVNATPVGSGEMVERSPVSASVFDHATVAFDLIYGARPTVFLRTAHDCGAKTLDGLDMLLRQAAAQIELWTGRKAPLAEMRAAAEAALRVMPPGSAD